MRNFLAALALVVLTALPRVWAAEAVLSSSETLTLNMLDVGLGTAIVVEVRGGQGVWRLLWDAGPEVSSKKIIRYFKRNHISSLDAVVASQQAGHHFDAMPAVFDIAKPKVVYWARLIDPDLDFYAFRVALEELGIKSYEVKRGDRIPAKNGLRISVLHPAQPRDLPDAGSIAALLQYQGVLFLLCADLPPADQAEVAKILIDQKAVPDFVLWPGHGAPIHPLFQKLLDSAAVVALSVGRNDLGLPKPNEALKNSRLVRSDLLDRPVEFRVLDGKLYTVEPE